MYRQKYFLLRFYLQPFDTSNDLLELKKLKIGMFERIESAN